VASCFQVEEKKRFNIYIYIYIYIYTTARLIISMVLENSIPSIQPLRFWEKRVREEAKANLLGLLLASIVIPSAPPAPLEKIRRRLLNQIQRSLVS
jgi:hypothetical protein